MHKYRAQRTTVDDIKFATKREARRYGELKLLAQAGVIQNLTCQPRFPLRVNNQLICTYVGDFSYFENNARVIEDVKSPPTRKIPVYRVKIKLLHALNPGIDHREVM